MRSYLTKVLLWQFVLVGHLVSQESKQESKDVATLVARLGAEQGLVRRRALAALASHGKNASIAVPHLIEMVLDQSGKYAEDIGGAIDAIERIGPDLAVEILRVNILRPGLAGKTRDVKRLLLAVMLIGDLGAPSVAMPEVVDFGVLAKDSMLSRLMKCEGVARGVLVRMDQSRLVRYLAARRKDSPGARRFAYYVFEVCDSAATEVFALLLADVLEDADGDEVLRCAKTLSAYCEPPKLAYVSFLVRLATSTAGGAIRAQALDALCDAEDVTVDDARMLTQLENERDGDVSAAYRRCMDALQKKGVFKR